MTIDNSIDVAQHCTTETPSTWRVILAPWIYIFRPGKAAETMVNATSSSFVISYLCGCIVFCGVILFFKFNTQILWRLTDGWEEMYLADLFQSARETWDHWMTAGVLLKFFIEAVLVCFGAIVLNVLLAWLLWPSLLTADGVTGSYRRSFRCTAAGLGLVSSLVLAIIIVLSSYFYGRLWFAPRTPHRLIFHIPAIIHSQVLVSFHLLLFWLRRAGNPLNATASPIELSPLCEGCGYDLTHQSSEGRCTECGLALGESLMPEKRRTGCLWEFPCHARFIPFIKTTKDCLRNLETFYGSLKLRTAIEPAMRYTTWNLVVLCLTCASWIFLAQLLWNRNHNYLSALYMSFDMLLLISLLGWIVNHLVGAIVTTWWVANDMLPDRSVARKVLAYESSVLWLFFIFTAPLLTSYFAFGGWVSIFVGRDFFFGMPMELFVIFLGYVLLAILSIRRFHRAFLAVRWANF